MKRYLCPSHSHKLADKTKSILLSTEKCSICRWDKRPHTLKDLARELEYISEAMRFAAEDESYDPFGYTWSKPFEDLVVEYVKMIHVDYRKSFLERLKELK